MKKLIFTLSIVLALGISFYAYPIIKDRYTDKSDISSKEKKIEIFNKKTMEVESPKADPSGDTLDSERKNSPVYLAITQEDCLNKCEEFENDKELEYCNQYCGISVLKAENEDCSNKTGLEKDYCHKNIAIEKTDFKECEKIEDKNIKESCTVRITEKIIEGAPGNDT